MVKGELAAGKARAAPVIQALVECRHDIASLEAMSSRFILPILALAFSGSLHANPEILDAAARQFGGTVRENAVLLRGAGAVSDPVEWTVYSRDAFRPKDILRMRVRLEGPAWVASADGAGSRILDRVPPRSLDSSRIRVRSSLARATAAKAAALAKATFVSVDYQLAANAETGAPEWGLALLDETGYETGFVVVSAENGAVLFQDWTPRVRAAADSQPDSEGERAARSVKRTARRAWNWTDNARRQTGEFFRELFR
ncbi:MAG TPA: hypothetical protein DIT13_08910 [Verrucomicrobiales bacterium]|nr:hypothetical protein [Verrucomicrobiales bacterium]